MRTSSTTPAGLTSPASPTRTSPSATARTSASAPQAAGQERPAPAVTAEHHGTPMLVLYGSNFGTAEDVAAQIAETATRRGFAARIAALDDHVDALPPEGVVAITTATYNGTPPDNAVGFARWLSEGSPDLTGVRYTVFG